MENSGNVHIGGTSGGSTATAAGEATAVATGTTAHAVLGSAVGREAGDGATGDLRRHALHATRARTATATLDSRSLDLLHGSKELRVIGLGKVGRESTHGVDGHLLGRHAATAALLTSIGRVLAGTTTLGRDAHSSLSEGHATAAGGGHKARLLTGSIVNWLLHKLLRNTSLGGSLLHAELVAGLDAGLELALANILALSESDVEGLVVNHALVHLGDGLGGIVGVAEADETEALALAELALLLGLGLLLGGLALLLLLALLLVLLVLLILSGGLNYAVAHDLGRGDGAVLGEHLAELVIINIISEVLDVEVDALVFVSLLLASSLIRPAELLLALVLLLGTADIQLLTTEILAVELLNSLGSSFVSSEVDKAKATALAFVRAGKGGGGDIAVLGEELTELLVGDLGGDVLDVDVGEVGLHLLKLALAILLGDVVADIDLLLVEKHAVDVLDGVGGSLVGLVVNETVTLGVAVLVLGDLAAQDVTESSEGVVKRLVVDGDIKVLNKDVALASLAQSRVTLRPHDAAGAALDESVVEVLEGLLAVGSGIVVHIGIAERTTSDGVAADTNRGNGADLGEELEEHGLSHRRVQLADVEGGRGLGVRSGRVGGRTGALLVLVLELASSHVGIDGGGIAVLTAVEASVAEISGKLVDSTRGNGSGHYDSWV